jgi:hypothetical protein
MPMQSAQTTPKPENRQRVNSAGESSRILACSGGEGVSKEGFAGQHSGGGDDNESTGGRWC